MKVFDEKNPRTLADCISDAIAAGLDAAAACPLKTLDTKVEDRQNAVGTYLQDTFELFKGLLRADDSVVLTGAVRWDWLRHDVIDKSPPQAGRPSATAVNTFSRLNPRAGLNYNLSHDYSVYFSYSQGFRAPAFLELTCSSPAAACPGLQAGAAPDPPLKSVKATNYEVGLRTRPTPWLESDLSLFRTDVSDDIFSVSPAGTTAVFFQNIGGTRRQGLEVSLRGTFGGPPQPIAGARATSHTT
nr:TonB-dependent receptor [Nitrospirota bacterium]